jgi:hypothetical protein
MTVIFPLEGDLFAWWESIKKLILFVERENSEGTSGLAHQDYSRVQPAAGHVTASVNAHSCLIGMKAFAARILGKISPA